MTFPGHVPAKAETTHLVTQAMLEISGLVGSSKQLDDILKRIVQITADMMQMPICSIYLIEADGILRKRSNVGLSEALSSQASFAMGEGIPGWVAQHGEQVARPDVTRDPRYKRHPTVDMRPHAYICSPLRVDDKIIGVLSAREMKVKTFTSNQRRVFETVSKMIAMVIQKHRMQEEMIEAQHLAAVATSLSEIAHYVKNIMFTVQVSESTITRVIENGESMDQVRDSWRALRRANQRIRKLVGDMLNYCRDKDLAYETVSLKKIISDVVEDLKYHATKHRVEIVTDMDQQIRDVEIDPSAVSDVLMNLVTNGVDAIPEGRRGIVTIRTRRSPDGKTFDIQVSDNGSGIPDDVRPRMFSLFFSTKGERGTGIGLAASKKIVERHGGAIDFETEAGRGTCFHVRLPVRSMNSAGPSVQPIRNRK